MCSSDLALKSAVVVVQGIAPETKSTEPVPTSVWTAGPKGFKKLVDLGAWIGWLTGKLPEFHDPCFAAKAANRDVTRVEATGSVLVQVDVLHRGMEQAGYAVG